MPPVRFTAKRLQDLAQGVCRTYREAVRELSPGFSLGTLVYSGAGLKDR